MSAMVRVDYEASTLTVPVLSAIDLGGIGKGMAADIVAEELVEAGATGALVNVGGDLRCAGRPGDDTSWFLGIEDPRHAAASRRVAAAAGRRHRHVGHHHPRWTHRRRRRRSPSHRPRTRRTVDQRGRHRHRAGSGRCNGRGVLDGSDDAARRGGMAMLERVHLAGLAVDDHGTVFTTSTLKDFTI